MRKSITIFFALFLIFIFAGAKTSAQVRRVQNLPNYNQSPYHFGFILGINQMLFSLKPADSLSYIKWDTEQYPDIFADSVTLYSVSPGANPGFTIGILGNLRLGKYFDMRFIPSLSFGERRINYLINIFNEGQGQMVTTTKSITSTLINFPLEFKYRSTRLNNFDAYVLGGLQYSLDLASQKKAQKNTSEITVKLKKQDVYVNVGVGFEFYTTYFKFGTELKMGYGMNQLLKNENNIYTNSIESLRSKVFLLSFTFE
ncbi:MAG TPA: PorT family protein [Bacteroidetes bacterium]|nr:PorT family protein [Bacteroidota bacterium]